MNTPPMGAKQLQEYVRENLPAADPILKMDGFKKPASEWIELAGKKGATSVDVVRLRLTAGWSAKEAIYRKEHRERMPKKRGGNSDFRGVAFHKASGLWQVRIIYSYKTLQLGYTATELEAAIHYNIAAAFIHGDSATMNVR